MNCTIYRLLNVYCEIFSTSSYGEGRTRTTFLLYTFDINLPVLSVNTNEKSKYDIGISIEKLL